MGRPIRIGFGEYLPDLAPLANQQGLVNAMNTVPIAGGYNGIGSLSTLASFTALAGTPRGAFGGIDSSGNPYNFAGSDTKIERMATVSGSGAGGTEDVSRTTGGAYNCSGECRWEFEVFGDYVIACNPNDVTQVIDLRETTPFEKLMNTLTVAPRAAHIGVIGSFVVLGNTYDDGNGLDETAIHWCALNDIFNWPTTGSEAAVAVQSDRQPLIGNGGAVQRVVSGAEVGAIFQEQSIWRAEYRGGSAVFELRRVEPDRGLLIPGFAIPFGRQVFYVHEDGFYLFDYTSSVPIGRERVDRTFLADVDEAYLYRCSAIKDPNNQRIWMTYPGANNVSGAPNKLLIYDWGLDRFTPGDEAIELLATVVDAGLHLDSDATAADPDAVDTAGLSSFDARIAGVGGRKLGGYNSSDQICDFSGLQRQATLETGRRELIPGRRSLATRARVLVDSVDPTVQAASLSRTNKPTVFGPARPIDEQGDAPLRTDARYHAFRVNLPPGFTNALGMDVSAQESGTR